MSFNASVEAGKNTIFFQAKGGEFVITPGMQPGAVMLTEDERFAPGDMSIKK